MSSLSYTAEREKKVGYSIPYVEASQAMVIRAGDQAHITSMIQSIDAGQTEAAK